MSRKVLTVSQYRLASHHQLASLLAFFGLSALPIAFEESADLGEAAGERLLAQFSHRLPEAELVMISGAPPLGFGRDFYCAMVTEAYRRTQLRTIITGSGTALQEVLPANPYLVLLSREELEFWASAPLSDEGAILGVATEVMDAGALVVAVSLGAQGLLLVSPMGSWRAMLPDGRAMQTADCREAQMAGFAVGLLRELSPEEVLRLAATCGAASATAGWEGIEQTRPRVRVDRID